ncbi:hypothetical protein [Streptomyces sp. NBC_00005]|uniref:hypothetical protein n=1 Tax=Streptomyces sp. NBC_00005 TaxID=2903609 RepID=UPI0032502DBE
MNATLEELMRLVPPATRPPIGDWDSAEQALHHHLPTDYKDLVNLYGSGAFCGYLELLVPPGVWEPYDIVEFNDGHGDYAVDVWREEDEKPHEFSADLGYELIAWASTIDGDTLYWLAHTDQKPESWRTLLVSEDLAVWEHYDAPAPAVLLGLLTGEIDSDIVTPDLSAVTFKPYPA